MALMKFPLHYKCAYLGPKSSLYEFYWTPICLSGPKTDEELENCLKYFEENPEFGGAYLQTRLGYHGVEQLNYLGKRIHLAHRTVFHLPTQKSEKDWFSSMKRDSKARFSKIQKELDENRLTIRNYDFADEVDLSTLETCFEIYCNLAVKNGFRPQYRFIFDELFMLISSEKWCLHTINVDEHIVGFSVLGDTGYDIDYTFAATLPSPYDVSRALILSAFRFGKSLQKNVCLGGGIVEDDELAMFKLRMGTDVAKFVNLKICGKALYMEAGEKFFENYKTRRWPDV